MTSPDSFYSGSPESKSILCTPESGPYSGYFDTTTPSDLRLSPCDGSSTAGWGALPSRLLDSPEPEARPYHPCPVPGKIKTLEELRGKLQGQSGITRGSGASSDGRVISFDSTTISSPPQYVEAANSSHGQDDPFCQAQQGSNQDTQWAVVPTRHLKIGGIPPAATSLMLFNKLSVSVSILS